jgi:hypothetical protein
MGATNDCSKAASEICRQLFTSLQRNVHRFHKRVFAKAIHSSHGAALEQLLYTTATGFGEIMKILSILNFAETNN